MDKGLSETHSTPTEELVGTGSIIVACEARCSLPPLRRPPSWVQGHVHGCECASCGKGKGEGEGEGASCSKGKGEGEGEAEAEDKGEGGARAAQI